MSIFCASDQERRKRPHLLIRVFESAKQRIERAGEIRTKKQEGLGFGVRQLFSARANLPHDGQSILKLIGANSARGRLRNQKDKQSLFGGTLRIRRSGRDCGSWRSRTAKNKKPGIFFQFVRRPRRALIRIVALRGGSGGRLPGKHGAVKDVMATLLDRQLERFDVTVKEQSKVCVDGVGLECDNEMDQATRLRGNVPIILLRRAGYF